MLEHGGRLHRAAREYGIPLEDWLDLSTGISPFAWPVPAIPPSAWHRLPEDDDGVIDAARAYYRAPHVLPVAGAIQALPQLRSSSRVGIIAPGYAEHAYAWQRAGASCGTPRGRRLAGKPGAMGRVGVGPSEQSRRRTVSPAGLAARARRAGRARRLAGGRRSLHGCHAAGQSFAHIRIVMD